jgi:tetratricopeptide (TPR) repeat protein
MAVGEYSLNISRGRTNVTDVAIRSRFLAVSAGILLTGLLGMATDLPAATPAEIQSLLKADKLDQAMREVEVVLRDDADNVELRFLKGIIHTRRNELDAAADEFLTLTQDHPNLPEPYNNLAVVYAAKGEYDKARQTLLRAINTHPSYATAYENIGDIYTKMASEAYVQALQLDESNITAREKLALVNELFSANLARQSAVAQAEPRVDARDTAETAPVPDEPVAPATTEPGPPAAEAPPELIATLPDEIQATTGPASEPVVPSAEEPEPATPEMTAAAAPPTPAPVDASLVTREQIESTVHNWARAWAAQDVNAYLAFYSDDFQPGGGHSRAEWAAQRRDRLTAPRYINLKIEDVQVTIEESNGEARARFRQTYESNTFNSSIMKTLRLTQVGDDWLIRRELTE